MCKKQEIMDQCKEWAKMQVEAGGAIWKESGLVEVTGKKKQLPTGLKVVDDEEFKRRWKNIHQRYGRYVCWVMFGVGFEIVVKGCAAILCEQCDFENKNVCVWRKKGEEWETRQFSEVCKFSRVKEYLKDNCDAARNIRNRDVHQYIRDCRDQNYEKDLQRIVDGLNKLLGAVRACV